MAKRQPSIACVAINARLRFCWSGSNRSLGLRRTSKSPTSGSKPCTSPRAVSRPLSLFNQAAAVEVGLIGREGMTGLPIVLG